MPNNVVSSVGPPDVLDGFYDSLNILRQRNDKTMDLLVVLKEEHKLLKKQTAKLGGDVGTLKNNYLLQDRRITTLEAEMAMVRAKSDPSMPASASGPINPSGNVSSTTKKQIRVSCPMCGKDLAKVSLRYHMKISCPNRPNPVLTQ